MKDCYHGEVILYCPSEYEFEGYWVKCGICNKTPKIKRKEMLKKLRKSEINRIGRWRAFMKGRRFWTDTDEEILQIILRLNEATKGGVNG